MKKITFLLLALICSVSMWAVDVVIDRTSWSVTGTAAPTSAIEYDNDGRVTAMLDGVNNTFFHSDWTGSQPGAGCPLGFQIDMADVKTITKVTLLPRQDKDAGAPTTWRIYVSNTSTDLSTLSTQEDRKTALAEATLEKTLGSATLSGTWSYSTGKELQTATFTTPATGRYILFVADDTRASDNHWLCVAEFNAYEKIESITYTVKGGSVIYDGTTYADGAAITLDNYIDESKLSAVEVAGKSAVVTVNGTTINVEYISPFVTPTVPTGYVPSVATTKTTAIESGKYYVVKGYNQVNATPIAYLYNNGGSIKGNTGTPTIDNNYVWYIQKRVGDTFYMYNMEKKQFVSMGSSNGSAISFADADAYVQFTAGDAGIWAIKNSTCSQWIDFGWAGTGPTTWGGGCGGSRRAEFYEVEYVDPIAAARTILQDAINNAKALIGINPGYYTSAAVSVHTDAAQVVCDNTSASVEELNNATTTLNNGIAALSPIMPSADKYYSIISAFDAFEVQQGHKKAICASDGTMQWKNYDKADESMIWTLEPTIGGYAMKNYKTGAYAGIQATQSATYPTSWDATVATLTLLGSGQFNIITTGSGYAMHTGGHSQGAGESGDIVAWNNGIGTGSAWYIVEVTPESEKQFNFDPSYEDYTGSLSNPTLNFDRSSSSWNGMGTYNQDGVTTYENEENVNFYQTITLPAGQYVVKAKAYYRAGKDGQDEYRNIHFGYDTHLASLYVNAPNNKQYTTPVTNAWEGATPFDYQDGTGESWALKDTYNLLVSEAHDSIQTVYEPNDLDAIKLWMSKPNYTNEVIFNLQEGGVVTLGIKKEQAFKCENPDCLTEQKEFLIQDYLVIGEWKLYRLGDAEKDDAEQYVGQPDLCYVQDTDNGESFSKVSIKPESPYINIATSCEGSTWNSTKQTFVNSYSEQETLAYPYWGDFCEQQGSTYALTIEKDGAAYGENLGARFSYNWWKNTSIDINVVKISTNAYGEKVATAATIIEPGEYTITIPENFFAVKDYEGRKYIYDEPIVVKFTVNAAEKEEVNPTTGINSVNANNEADIFTLSGVKVNKAQKGVYIIAGKKVLK